MRFPADPAFALKKDVVLVRAKEVLGRVWTSGLHGSELWRVPRGWSWPWQSAPQGCKMACRPTALGVLSSVRRFCLGSAGVAEGIAPQMSLPPGASVECGRFGARMG